VYAVLAHGTHAVFVRFDTVIEPIIAAVFLAILLRVALTNHRSEDRTPRRLWTQGLWLTGGLAAATIAAAVVHVVFSRPF
jgi:hypothetical protein